MLSLYFEVIYELVVKLGTSISIWIHQEKEGLKGLKCVCFEFKSSLYSVEESFSC